MCRPRFDVATFIANEDSLDCRGAPARGGTPPAALADCALLLHGIDPIPQRRCCAGGGRGHAGLDQRLSPQVARKHGFGGFLASILRMSWHQLKACPAEIAHFVHGIRILAICSCGGILQICQWYRVCDAGALRAEPLGHPLYLARSQHVPAKNLHAIRLHVLPSLPWVVCFLSFFQIRLPVVLSRHFVLPLSCVGDAERDF